MYLGIEIGGTKLQLGLGAGDGVISQLWRGSVNAALGGEGIRQQILAAVPMLLNQANRSPGDLKGIGVGFGGPTDDATQSVIKSHHIAGWDGFPLAQWLEELLHLPTAICNDADVAGLGEARFGAGRGLSPVFYITVGTGIGGGLILNGEIYRGVGKGAAEIGHVRPAFPLGSALAGEILEAFASGTGIGHQGSMALGERRTGAEVAALARERDPRALAVLDTAVQALAEGCCTVIKLLCPRRIIIGGGVSLLGDEWLFAPLRRYVQDRGFQAFAGLTDIVPAALGEEVVVHGALALARQHFGG
jgi:glucokinase